MEEHQEDLGGRVPRQTVAHVKDLDGGMRGQKQEKNTCPSENLNRWHKYRPPQRRPRTRKPTINRHQSRSSSRTELRS